MHRSSHLRPPMLPFLGGSLVAIAWLLRGLGLFESGLSIGSCDLTGFLADAGGGLAFAILAAGMSRLSRPLALLPSLFWLLVAHASYEQFRALGSDLRWEEWTLLLDPTFLLGSALRPIHPVLLALLALWIGLVVLRASPWKGLSRRSVPVALGLALLLVVTAGTLPRDPRCLEWRTTGALPDPLPSRHGPEPPSRTSRTPVSVLGVDLSGERQDLASPPDNVLLVLLEGVSGRYLPSVAEAHGWTARPAMSRLDAIVRRGRWAETFVAQQRQTQRGMYAVLCGDLPKLRFEEPRFADLARGLPLHPCLPELLRQRGLATAYLQAAPLAFMQKDQALPVMGFDEVRGSSSIPEGGFRTQWGVDDETFLRHALEEVDRLEELGQPWFLTLLTVGTHHPFVVPPRPELESMVEGDRPFQFLDRSFSAFWQALGERELLDDTLVVLTSDESLGVEEGDDLHRTLSQSLGFAALLGPGLPPARIREPFSQADLALTVLDALGAEPGPGTIGRSMLREYAEPRPLFFGNIYLRRTFGWFPGGRLYACADDLLSCTAWSPPDGDPFGAGSFRETGAVSEELETLRRIARFSLREGGHASGPRSISLLRNRSVDIPDTTDYQLLFGEQHLDLPPGELTVTLEGRIQGDEGWVHLRHDVVASTGSLLVTALPALAPGDGFRLEYRIRAHRGLRNLSIRASADRLEGRELGLRFDVARARFVPLEETSLPPEPPTETSPVEILERSIDRERRPSPRTLELADWTELPRCLERRDRVVRGDCPPSILLGPAVSAPRESEVEVVWTLSGSGTVQGLLGEPELGVLLASTREIRLRSDRVREARLATRVDAVLHRVRTALDWAPRDSRGSLTIEDLRIVVHWP